MLHLAQLTLYELAVVCTVYPTLPHTVMQVHDLGKSETEGLHKVEIRCDVTRRTDDGSKIDEEKRVVEIKRKD